MSLSVLTLICLFDDLKMYKLVFGDQLPIL